MTKSSRLSKQPGQMAERPSRPSAFKLVSMTLFGTTWRTFVPTLGGLFLGLALDRLFGIAPLAVILCLIIGVIVSIVLVILQIRSVQRLIKK